MSKYRVWYTEKVYYEERVIEAEDEEQAENMYMDMFDAGDINSKACERLGLSVQKI